MAKSRLLQPPWLELTIMFVAVILSYAGLSIISSLSAAPAAGEMSNGTITLWLLAFFLLSFVITIISVLAGIGGGVIFTPIMMAFTPIDSVVIRATGLLIAMFSGLIAASVYMKKGIGNLKLCATLAVSQGIGALIGAQTAVVSANAFGATGDGVLRIVLGIMLLAISVYLIMGSKKLEWPNIQNTDAFTKWMKLDHTYYEESDGKVHSYRITRILLGLVFLLGIGFLGGFFGMGAGWAITPVQNLAMGVPLKAAMANTVIIISMVDCVSVWPYILAGGIIPLFVLPWLAAQLFGGSLGANIMVRIKVTVVRLILIGIMIFTSFTLVTDGLTKLKLMPKMSGAVTMVVFVIVMIIDGVLIYSYMKNESEKK